MTRLKRKNHGLSLGTLAGIVKLLELPVQADSSMLACRIRFWRESHELLSERDQGNSMPGVLVTDHLQRANVV
jgi:hypothetical protein